MSAIQPLSLVSRGALGNPSQGATTPAGAEIHVRDLRFGRSEAPQRWGLAEDPVATAWHTGLSATFPRGEAFFIESVKACREGAPPALAAAIGGFIRQEINHTREHLAFNRLAMATGYDLSRVDARVDQLIGETRGKPPAVNLAITMALEHFTAMFAHEFLANPRHFTGAASEAAAMWRWHAVEELEHKGVAFDTWRHFTRAWPRRRRWLVRSAMMLLVTRKFLANRVGDALDLLDQDSIHGWRAKARLLHYLVVRPGVLRRIFPAWLAYFRPGFHPWHRDDRALIAAAERDLRPA